MTVVEVPRHYHVLPRSYLRNDKGESVVADLLRFGDGFGNSMRAQMRPHARDVTSGSQIGDRSRV